MFGVVPLVTFIMHIIYSLLIAVVVASYLCLSELLSAYGWINILPTGDGQIMETLDNMGIKLFVLAALKEH